MNFLIETNSAALNIISEAQIMRGLNQDESDRFHHLQSKARGAGHSDAESWEFSLLGSIIRAGDRSKVRETAPAYSSSNPDDPWRVLPKEIVLKVADKLGIHANQIKFVKHESNFSEASESRPKFEGGAGWMYHMLKNNTFKAAYKGSKLFKVSREDLAKRLGFEAIADAQDFIAHKPMDAFRAFMKSSPRRDVKPVSFVEPFILVVALLSGHEMAAIIFEKHFMSRKDVKDALDKSEMYRRGEERFVQDAFDDLTNSLRKAFGSKLYARNDLSPGMVPPVPFEFEIEERGGVKSLYRLKYDGEWYLNMAVYPNKKFNTVDDVVKWVEEDIQNQISKAEKKAKKSSRK